MKFHMNKIFKLFITFKIFKKVFQYSNTFMIGNKILHIFIEHFIMCWLFQDQHLKVKYSVSKLLLLNMT